jgi:cytochrome c oxidase subunit IV
MERDDIIEYSLYTHHDEAEGKKIRAKIWKVTIILTLITIIEIAAGVYFPRHNVSEWVWFGIKISYIGLTVFKASYIVLTFMHLGDERKNLKMVILAPYILFILYLVYICLTEATYVHSIWEALP